MTENPSPRALFSRKDFLCGALLAAFLPAWPRLARADSIESVFHEVAPGVFVHVGRCELVNAKNEGDISNVTLIVGGDTAAVIDTGGSYRFGVVLREAMAKITNKPIRYVVNTHMHPDHVLGNAAFEGIGAEFVGHHKLPAALAARSETYLRRARERLGEPGFEGTKIVMPTKVVTGTQEIDLGGRILTLKARPTAHTDNDLTIFDNQTETLFLGDLLFSGHVPTLDGSIVGWLKLIPELMQEKAARAIPGHGPQSMPWPDAIIPERRYLETIASEVREMVKAGDTLDRAIATVGKSERANWQLFDEHNGMNVTAAFTELEWE